MDNSLTAQQWSHGDDEPLSIPSIEISQRKKSEENIKTSNVRYQTNTRKLPNQSPWSWKNTSIFE
jgi:hypothetical protein